MRNVAILLFGIAAACGITCDVAAQDVVVMRRSLAPAQRSSPSQTPAPVATTTPTATPTTDAAQWTIVEWDWPAGTSTCAPDARQTATYACRTAGGVSSTTCGTRPPTETRPAPRTDGCTYTPVYGDFSPWSDTCAAGASKTRDNACRRDVDGRSVDVSFCGIVTPETQRQDVYSGCAGEWVSQYGACGQDDRRMRTSTCRSKTDGTPLGDAACDPGAKPADGPESCGTWVVVGYGVCDSTDTQPQSVKCAGLGTGDDASCRMDTRPPARVSCRGEWQITTGICTNYQQTVTATCNLKDGGKQTDETDCNQTRKPSTAPVACGVKATCGTLTQNRYVTGTPTVITSSGLDTIDKAQASCSKQAASNGAGACLWNTTNKATYWVQGGTTIDRQQTNLYATTCR